MTPLDTAAEQERLDAALASYGETAAPFDAAMRGYMMRTFEPFWREGACLQVGCAHGDQTSLLPDNRFLFGGRGGLSASPAAADAFRARLTADFRRRFPAWRDVAITHFWSGLVDLASDLVPHCAALDATTFHACAYHGNGVALGTEMGAQLALLATAGTAPALPGFMRQPPPPFVLPSLRKAYLAAALSFYALKDAVS